MRDSPKVRLFFSIAYNKAYNKWIGFHGHCDGMASTTSTTKLLEFRSTTGWHTPIRRTLVLNFISSCLRDGLGVLVQMITYSRTEHQDLRTSHPVTFLLRRYIKDNVYTPPLSLTIPEIHKRITNVTAKVSQD